METLPLASLPFLPTATVYETSWFIASALTVVVTFRIRGRMPSPVDRWKFGIRLGFSSLSMLVALIAMLDDGGPFPTVSNTLVTLAAALSQCGNLMITAIEYAYVTRHEESAGQDALDAERYRQRLLDAQQHKVAE